MTGLFKSFASISLSYLLFIPKLSQIPLSWPIAINFPESVSVRGSIHGMPQTRCTYRTHCSIKRQCLIGCCCEIFRAIQYVCSVERKHSSSPDFFPFALHIQPGAESLIRRVRDKPFLSGTFPRIDSHDLYQPVQGHHNICQDSPRRWTRYRWPDSSFMGRHP